MSHTVKCSDYRDAKALSVFLQTHWGNAIRFGNGCTIHLEDDDEVIWGGDPYGQDWGCDYEPGWEAEIHTWLLYWDEPRDEAGQLYPDELRDPETGHLI